MKWKPYPAYKNSGVDWLGEVPEDWEVATIGRLFEIQKRIVCELGHDVLSITQRGIQVKDTESNDGQLSMDYSKYQTVEVGDFAMNHMDLITGFIDIAQVSGVTSPDYRVFRLRHLSEANSRFFLAVFQDAYRRKLFFPFGQGSSQLGRWRLPTDAFKEYPVPVPPKSEQSSIATFLDHETAKLDTLIAKQEMLIELLQEKRQALISHAVTKGLNPDAPMKDSGVAWLGEIPAHWEIGAIKRYFMSLDSRRVPLSAEERGTRQGQYPYYGASGVIDFVDDFLFEEDLVLVSEDGANLLNRSTAIAFVATGKYWVNNHAHILKPIDSNLVFWAATIESLNLTPFVSGSAQPKLTAEALMNLMIAIPPPEEERVEIEAYIRSESAKLDTLIEKSRHSIELMREHRTALIAAAVTGKIDLREAA